MPPAIGRASGCSDFSRSASSSVRGVMTSTLAKIRYAGMKSLLADAHVLTVDEAGTEHADGWILIEDGFVAAVGDRDEPEADERVGLGGAVVTPGLVNTHHHLYQTLTRARAQQATLFEWLVELYPTWARIDAEAEYAAARTGLAELMLSGCTTVFDHHYVFPRGRAGLVEAEIQAAQELGCRIVASRGSMDLGVSDGGLPPDELVEEHRRGARRHGASRRFSARERARRAAFRSPWHPARPSRSPDA